MEKEHQVPIWFFIGSLLTIYGVLICGSGIYRWKFSAAAETVALSHLHADVWWGALLLVLGLIYVIRFWPSKN